MSSRSFYVQKMKKLHTRYGLSANATRLLKVLDDYKMGSLDDDELGRFVRLSPNMRKAVTDTISQCASVMEKKPEEVKDCVALIQNCTEILAVADKPTMANQTFNFMKLPKEIRLQIYEAYLQSVMCIRTQAVMLPTVKLSTCACAPHEKPLYGYRKFTFNLAQTSKLIHAEFMKHFYERQTFYFSCACELNRRLRNNPTFWSSIRSVKVHWAGINADQAFVTLGACRNLKSLNIVISKATGYRMTKRQEEMTLFFPATRPTRLTDALGIDELLKIRGIRDVKVSHIPTRQGVRRTDEDKANLQAMLSFKLTLPREGESMDWTAIHSDSESEIESEEE